MAQLQISFSRGGVVRADLLMEDAPRISQDVLTALPFESEVKHANFFGPVLRARVPWLEERVENPFVLGVRAGEILVRPAPASSQQDLLIAFGHALFLEDEEWVQHSMFARVVPEDIDLLVGVGRRIRTHGAERLSVTTLEPAAPAGC